MTIKRKSNYQQKLSTNNSSKLKANGLGKYRYPIYGDIPGGWYVSKITDAKMGTTRKGKSSIEVYYEIEPVSQCYKRMNDLLKDNYKDERYYIKQSYPEDTQFYDDFADAMADALGKDAFDLSETIGVTEQIQLTYNNYNNFGGIDGREPIKYEDYIKTDEPKDGDCENADGWV